MVFHPSRVPKSMPNVPAASCKEMSALKMYAAISISVVRDACIAAVVLATPILCEGANLPTAIIAKTTASISLSKAMKHDIAY